MLRPRFNIDTPIKQYLITLTIFKLTLLLIPILQKVTYTPIHSTLIIIKARTNPIITKYLSLTCSNPQLSISKYDIIFVVNHTLIDRFIIMSINL